MSPSAEALREALEKDGFVAIPDAISEQDLQRLREACQKLTQQARSKQWPYVRTLPKQFPPWNDDTSNGIWGVQHLLHPDQVDKDVFAASYFNETIINSVTTLLECSRDDLVMELYNVLVRPDHDFSLRWHRDDVGPDASSDEELRRLSEPILHAQWNLALYDDASLIVVPGSQNRARTGMERKADPYDEEMPGQQVVQMKAGDVVFYNNNILHRGVYKNDVERMTLHGSMGVSSADPARARNILQHGIGDWAGKCDFSCLPADKVHLAEAMKQRLIAMGSGKDVGYSQSDV